jgi:hypothetical protein
MTPKNILLVNSNLLSSGESISFILGLDSMFKMSAYEVCLYDAQRAGLAAGLEFIACPPGTAAD